MNHIMYECCGIGNGYMNAAGLVWIYECCRIGNGYMNAAGLVWIYECWVRAK